VAMFQFSLRHDFYSGSAQSCRAQMITGSFASLGSNGRCLKHHRCFITRVPISNMFWASVSGQRMSVFREDRRLGQTSAQDDVDGIGTRGNRRTSLALRRGTVYPRGVPRTLLGRDVFSSALSDSSLAYRTLCIRLLVSMN
jgi:hypothetical protein